MENNKSENIAIENNKSDWSTVLHERLYKYGFLLFSVYEMSKFFKYLFQHW